MPVASRRAERHRVRCGALSPWIVAWALGAGCGSNAGGGMGGGSGAGADGVAPASVGGASGSASSRAGGGGTGESDGAGGGAGAGAGSAGAIRDAGRDGGLADAGTSGSDDGGDGGDALDGGHDGGSTARPGWKLQWSDEFEGPEGSAPDADSWSLQNKGDGFGNDELEFYRDGANNAAMDGHGSLVITAKEESFGGRDYTSARLESSGKVEQKYGRIEARIKLPRGQGIWPAFWMLGNDIGSVGWPGCGEIDIMENIGREPSIVHGSLHGPGYSGGNPLGAAYTLPGGAELADDFHVFAVEWKPDEIAFFVDDQRYETRTPNDVPAGHEWVYDHPFFIILNMAVGGQWPGAPDESTTFPQTMLVDYVRVYDPA